MCGYVYVCVCVCGIGLCARLLMQVVHVIYIRVERVMAHLEHQQSCPSKKIDII